MRPHERFLTTAEFEIYSPGISDIRVKFKQTSIPDKTPDEMIPNSIVVNTADQRLWLSDENGKPVEYQLVEVIQEQDNES